MENELLPLKGASVNEYRLIVQLPEDLSEKIMAIRKVLHEKYKVESPFEIAPSLTILRFHAFEQGESKALERIQKSVLTTKPFLVQLEDYSGYPSHTIYINVKTRSVFNEVSKTLKVSKKYLKIPGKDPHFINEPHLILAQRLAVNEFERMWRECEHRQFTGRFICDHLLLLKRSDTRRRYEPLRKFEFQELPSNLKQTALLF
jgi:hypothetical protein